MKGISWFAYSVSKKHQKIINTNLDIAFNKKLSKAEKKAYGISAFMNLLDTTLGIIKRDGMKQQEVIKDVSFEGSSIVKNTKMRVEKSFLLQDIKEIGNYFLNPLPLSLT